jgi:hypothetical protein
LISTFAIFAPLHEMLGTGRQILLLALLVSGCANPAAWEPAATRLNGRTEVPIALPARGIPGVVVNQSTDADSGAAAILDTGSPATFVTKRFASAQKLKVRHLSLQLTDAQGKTLPTPRVARVPAMTIGGARFENFDAIVADLPAMKALGEQLDVVLSRALFRDVLITIDYPRRRLILEPGALPEPNGKDVLPLRRDEQGQLLVPLRLLGEEAWFVLDTGHTGEGLLLSRYRLIAVPWATTPVDAYRVQTFLGTARARVGRMNEVVQLGQYTISRPIIGISFDDNVEILGADVLRHFIVTIDQQNGRVRFTRASTQPIQTPPIRRLGFEFADERGSVEPTSGSEAQSAGLRPGDRVLAINGVPRERLSPDHLEQIELAGDAVELRVLRDGRQIALTVPLTVVVP